MNIISVAPRTDPLWQRLTTESDSSVFHSPAWMQVLADTYGWEPQAFLLLDDAGNPQAGIPFCRIADIRGERIASLPFSDFCDPLVTSFEQWKALIDGLLEEQRPLAVRPLHNEIPLQDERFTLVNKARWHGMDLHPDIDAHWSRIESSARRAISKAERNGISVRFGQAIEDVRAFFDMHLGIRKYKYHMLAQPYSFFENIWRQFMAKDEGFVALAEHEGQVVGGIFFLKWHNTLVYKFNASRADSLEFRPTDLLIWESIKYGKSLGLQQLDFGLSDWDQDGLIRFKRKFADCEKTISFLRYTPNGFPTPQQKQAGELLPKLTNLFTDTSVPDKVTEDAGNLLYRFFV
ncbi:MAG TPA: GNAT family N-acetyltransferase [Aggregatilineaceae bacterium]|nr:GNAT family N-acetyltransferase [Aggregatilineaceae bacterium]